MSFWDDVQYGPGFAVDGLTAGELAHIRNVISNHYLSQMARLAPALVDRAAEVEIENYHTLPIPFDHGNAWSKAARLLPVERLTDFANLSFFDRVRQRLPSAEVIHEDLMWRLVRPNEPGDVGPIHADKWFWDAGNGSIPPGYERVKVWIAVHTIPGVNGLSVKSHSHKSNQWQHHFEHRHGIRKPVLDENPEDLKMELLPLAAGQLVFLHDSLLHGGVVNRGNTCRVSIELTVIYRGEEGQMSRAA